MKKDAKELSEQPSSVLQEAERLKRQLEQQLAEIETFINQLQKSTNETAASISVNVAPRSRSRRSVRELCLDALDDLGFATYSRQLANYISCQYGRAVDPTRFGSLAAEEVKAYEKALEKGRGRPVWLCFALTFDRAEPIKRLWTRSDWPLEQRIVAPTTGRVQHLKITARLCELAMEADSTAADPEMLKIIAADHARGLDTVKVRNGEFPLEEWRAQALRLLTRIEPEDEQRRREAAERWQREPEQFQLFGKLETVGEPNLRLIQRG